MDYYTKYIKYKTKYLELKEQIKGGNKQTCWEKEYNFRTHFCSSNSQIEPKRKKGKSCSTMGEYGTIGANYKCESGRCNEVIGTFTTNYECA